MLHSVTGRSRKTDYLGSLTPGKLKQLSESLKVALDL